MLQILFVINLVLANSLIGMWKFASFSKFLFMLQVFIIGTFNLKEHIGLTSFISSSS